MIFERLRRTVREDRLEDNRACRIEQQRADIDFIAIMTDVDIFNDEEEEGGENGELGA